MIISKFKMFCLKSKTTYHSQNQNSCLEFKVDLLLNCLIRRISLKTIWAIFFYTHILYYFLFISKNYFENFDFKKNKKFLNLFPKKNKQVKIATLKQANILNFNIFIKV